MTAQVCASTTIRRALGAKPVAWIILGAFPKKPQENAAMMVVATHSAGTADPPAEKRQRDWRMGHAGKRRALV